MENHTRSGLLLLVWFSIPLIVLPALMPGNSSPRFTLPLLVPVALSISIFIFSLKKEMIRYALISLVVIAGMGQFFLISYIPGRYYAVEGINYRLGLDVYPNVYLWNTGYGIYPPYTAEIGLFHSIGSDWGIGEIVSAVNSTAVNRYDIRIETFNQVVSMPLGFYYAARGDKRIKVTDSEHSPPGTDLGSPDFVVVTGMRKLSDVTSLDILSNIDASITQFRNMAGYALMKQVTLPDNTSMQIYRKLG
jgi:hypothetical protein